MNKRIKMEEQKLNCVPKKKNLSSTTTKTIMNLNTCDVKRKEKEITIEIKEARKRG